MRNLRAVEHDVDAWSEAIQRDWLMTTQEINMRLAAGWQQGDIDFADLVGWWFD